MVEEKKESYEEKPISSPIVEALVLEKEIVEQIQKSYVKAYSDNVQNIVEESHSKG